MSKQSREKYAKDPYYSTCCHIGRPEGESVHNCGSREIQFEHPFGRQNGYKDIVVPVCPECNYSPSKQVKAWSILKAFEKYGIEHIQSLNYKKDCDALIRQCLFLVT